MDNETAVAIQAVVMGHSDDPFAVLGRHRAGTGHVLRVMAPGAHGVSAVARDDPTQFVELHAGHHGGLFSGPIFADAAYVLRIQWADAIQETEDPYSFSPLLGAVDLHLLAEGRHREISQCLGAHAMRVDGADGVRFAVWAPNARRVSVVGDFNSWDGRRHPMRARHDAGVWELFIPRLRPGAIYKYEILDRHGRCLPLKADPVAWQVERPPATASIVADPQMFHWSDDDWLATRADRHAPTAPISVYEVHAASWMRGPTGAPLDWEGLTERLVPYVRDMGFTHIEFMPVMAHPFGGSWGYQPLGQFAPHALLGRPEEFARLIDRCHRAGIGVILDWVPAHFPNDPHGLAQFDGTHLYEHADPREGFHPDWNSMIYNLGRHEVRGFLIGSALHWLEHFHADGLRVDAVASMLYRDYSREPDRWIPNIHGGRENLEAISFLRELSQTIEERYPGVALVAEESTAWPGVTQPPAAGGLGFDYKWNMGWMHDTLQYMAHDPVHRRFHHDKMTFGLVYAFSERFMLPLSHDEVVHGKGSLLGKMPGDRWQKLANLRAYFGFMWGHPGKKLLFMGGEFAQEREWNHDTGLDWHLLDDPAHRGVHRLVRDLNHAYRAAPALHAGDCFPDGFRWIIGDDKDQSVYAFLRLSTGEAPVLTVCNFTPVPRHGYRIGVPHAGRWRELINTDAAFYGGSGIGYEGGSYARVVAAHGQPASVDLTLPPLSTLMLQLEI